MKIATVVLASLAAGATAVPLEKRQNSFQSLLDERGLKFSDVMTAFFGGFLRTKNLLKVERNLATTMRREKGTIKHMKVTYGPYKIRGMLESKKFSDETISMDAAGTAYNHMAPDFPKDVTLVSVTTNYVLKDGTPSTLENSGLFSHHLVAVDWSKGPPTVARCPDGMAIEPKGISFITGSAEDKGDGLFSTRNGNFPSGYYIGPKDQVAIFTDVVNYRNETQDTYAEFDIHYIEGKQAATTEATIQLWDVGVCDGNFAGVITQPKDQQKFSIISKDLTIEQDGVFLNFRGHLHDGGTNLTAAINGKEVCASQAKYTTTGITDMEYCSPDPPIKVKRGDVLKLQANYDLDQHPPRQHTHGNMAEQMALMAVYFTGPGVK